MVYDVARVRGLYVSLSDGWTYLNPHERSQIPELVSAGVATAFRTSSGLADSGPESGSHSKPLPLGTTIGDYHLDSARAAVADLTGSTPDRVVLGPSKAMLLRVFAEAMRPRLRRTTRIILARHDSPEVTHPFTSMEAPVVWAEPDLGTGVIPPWQYNDLATGSTRLVVVPSAHPLVGTVNDVEAITETVRDHSRAWVLVDASATAPYRSVNIDDLGADILAIEMNPFGGPHMAALVFRDTTMFPLLKAMNPLAPADSAQKLEIGGHSAGLMGGVSPLVDHYASLNENARGTRRHRLGSSMQDLARYLHFLTLQLIDSLEGLGNVHLVGISGDAAGEQGRKVERIPRLTFLVNGVPSATVYERLLSNGLVTMRTPANPLLDAMGIDEDTGAITVGLSPFSTSADIDQLTRVIASLG